MSKGRRLALLQQACLVWASDADYFTYVESGSLKKVDLTPAPNPLADRIAADIMANGGKLIVDEKRFAELAAEAATAAIQREGGTEPWPVAETSKQGEQVSNSGSTSPSL